MTASPEPARAQDLPQVVGGASDSPPSLDPATGTAASCSTAMTGARSTGSGLAATALTAASLAASMGLGAVLAVGVLTVFGKTADTDAFFAAYGVFAFLSAGASNMRVSLPARLQEGHGWQAVNRELAGVLVLIAVTAVPLLVLGRVTADALVGPLGPRAVTTGSTTLAYLWAAGSLHLLAGLLAASLGARNRHHVTAGAYVAGTAVTVSLLLLLAQHVTVSDVAAMVAMGALVTLAILAVRLLSLGWRPRLEAGALTAAAGVTVAAAFPLSLQAGFLVSVAAAAEAGQGAVTLYTYAFFGAVLVVGVTAAPASMVLAGSLARAWDQRLETLLPLIRDLTLKVLLAALPLLGAGILLGDEILLFLLGERLAPADAAAVTAQLLALTGLVVAQAVGVVPLVAAYAMGRHAGVAVASCVALAAHVLLTQTLGGEGLSVAAAASSSSLVLLAALLAVVFGRRPAPARRLLDVGHYACRSAARHPSGAAHPRHHDELVVGEHLAGRSG